MLLGNLNRQKQKLLMAEWLEKVSQQHEIYSHDLEVMSSNPNQVELRMHSTSEQVVLEPQKTWWKKVMVCSCGGKGKGVIIILISDCYGGRWFV